MTRLMPLLAFLTLLPVTAQAACYAEYKAKQDNPLRLHYGILLVDNGACPASGQATATARARLDRAGWTLLNVLSLSDKQPNARQRANAGEHYLRY